jgi:hypothetical protein
MVVSLEPSSCSHVTWWGVASGEIRPAVAAVAAADEQAARNAQRTHLSQSSSRPGSWITSGGETRRAPGAASSRQYATHLKRLVLGVLARHSQAQRQPPHTNACLERTTERTSQACGGGVGGAFSTARSTFFPPGTPRAATTFTHQEVGAASLGRAQVAQRVGGCSGP